MPSVETQAIQLENTSAIVTTNLITDSATEETPAAVSHRHSINFASSSFRIRGVIFFTFIGLFFTISLMNRCNCSSCYFYGMLLLGKLNIELRILAKNMECYILHHKYMKVVKFSRYIDCFTLHNYWHIMTYYFFTAYYRLL